MKTSGKSTTAFDNVLSDYLSGEQSDAEVAWEKLASTLDDPTSNLTTREKELLKGLRSDELLLRSDSRLLTDYRADTPDPVAIRAMVRGWSKTKGRKRASNLARWGLSLGVGLACLFLVISLIFSLTAVESVPTSRQGSLAASIPATVGTPATTWSPYVIIELVYPVRGSNYLMAQFGDLVDGKRSDGIDIAAAYGTPIIAAAKGTVVGAGWMNDQDGNAVVIDHNNGYFTRYTHLEKVEVAPGQTVNHGNEIGTMGTTGAAVGIHLHFELVFGGPDGERQDPLPYIVNFLAGIRYDQPTPTPLP